MVGVRLAIVVVAAAAALAVPARPAYACSCATPPPDEDALRQADAVFTGRATSAAGGLSWTAGSIKWNFEIDHVHKGRVYELQQVSTPDSSAACGFKFRAGARYIVFARGDSPRNLTTIICDNTRKIAEDKTLRLGESGSPLSGRSHAASWLSLLWKLAAGAAAVWLLARWLGPRPTPVKQAETSLRTTED